MPAWRELGYLHRGTITPTDVKDYVYCPAIPWIRRSMGLSEPPTPSMEEGAMVGAEEKLEAARSLGFPEPVRVEVALKSRSVPLEGVADIVAGSRRLVVAEVKRVSRVGRHHIAQLKVYALLAEESIGPVGEAVLIVRGGRALRLTVTSEVLEEARLLASKAYKASYSDDPPKVSQPEAKCRYCFFSRVCPVRS